MYKERWMPSSGDVRSSPNWTSLFLSRGVDVETLVEQSGTAGFVTRLRRADK